MRIPFLILMVFLSIHPASAQYILNGAASQVSCNCYTLTPPQINQAGSVWNRSQIDLRQSFDFWFNIYLGCNDANGADGIVFILQPNSASVGTTGEGLGFGGLTPSVGIALDTWQNLSLNDPAFDHISIQTNGQINHGSDLAGPIPISPISNNVEDCKWHRLRIKWDAGTRTLTTFFDGMTRLQAQVDLVGTVFNNNPVVYWGFSGATGGAFNLQQFCTALNPFFGTNAPSNQACPGDVIQFTNASESFAPIVSYNWNFGDGTSQSGANPPAHQYTQSGQYNVRLQVKGQDGCEADTSLSVTIGDIPDARLNTFDTCAGNPYRVQFTTQRWGIEYEWLLNGSTIARGEQPVFAPIGAGSYELALVASSSFGCGVPDTARSIINIKPAPQVRADFTDVCLGELVRFNGTQLDALTTISAWNWDFGDGSRSSQQQTTRRYSSAGTFSIRLWAAGTNGCISDTATAPLIVNQARVFAGNDTAVIVNQPFQLQGSGNGRFAWAPSFALSNPAIANPSVSIGQDEQFVLTVTTPEGCTASDTVLVKAFKGPAVYVPNAFTPNGDGRNDMLRPVYVGIKELRQFVVYNRWGQQVFQTRDRQRGWEPGNNPTGTYVWMVQVVDDRNQPLLLKGTVTVIR